MPRYKKSIQSAIGWRWLASSTASVSSFSRWSSSLAPWRSCSRRYSVTVDDTNRQDDIVCRQKTLEIGFFLTLNQHRLWNLCTHLPCSFNLERSHPSYEFNPSSKSLEIPSMHCTLRLLATHHSSLNSCSDECLWQIHLKFYMQRIYVLWRFVKLFCGGGGEYRLIVGLSTLPVTHCCKTKWSYFMTWHMWNTWTVTDIHLNLHMPQIWCILIY